MSLTIRCAATALALALAPAGVVAQGSPLGTPVPGQPLGTTTESDHALETFLPNQLLNPRVADARDETDADLRTLFHEKGVTYPAPEIFLRVFKHERVMELWARSRGDSTFTLMREYPVCALPGQLGPKQKMGDYQVPEGFYFIDQFNPRSNYHLSLRVSYPNVADRIRREAVALGGDIFVHGGCETVGCVPIENRNIQEVYWLAAQAMDAGQRIIPIHIFPSRMDEASLRWLEQTFQPEPRLLGFWQNLAEGYAYFEETRRVPWITTAPDGRYLVPELDRLAGDDDTTSDTPSDTASDTAATPQGAGR